MPRVQGIIVVFATANAMVCREAFDSVLALSVLVFGIVDPVADPSC